MSRQWGRNKTLCQGLLGRQNLKHLRPSKSRQVQHGNLRRAVASSKHRWPTVLNSRSTRKVMGTGARWQCTGLGRRTREGRQNKKETGSSRRAFCCCCGEKKGRSSWRSVQSQHRRSNQQCLGEQVLRQQIQQAPSICGRNSHKEERKYTEKIKHQVKAEACSELNCTLQNSHDKILIPGLRMKPFLEAWPLQLL